MEALPVKEGEAPLVPMLQVANLLSQEILRRALIVTKMKNRNMAVTTKIKIDAKVNLQKQRDTRKRSGVE